MVYLVSSDLFGRTRWRESFSFFTIYLKIKLKIIINFYYKIIKIDILINLIFTIIFFFKLIN